MLVSTQTSQTSGYRDDSTVRVDVLMWDVTSQTSASLSDDLICWGSSMSRFNDSTKLCLWLKHNQRQITFVPGEWFRFIPRRHWTFKSVTLSFKTRLNLFLKIRRINEMKQSSVWLSGRAFEGRSCYKTPWSHFVSFTYLFWTITCIKKV